MSHAPFVAVARVVKVHGTHGELSVAPTGPWPIDALLGTVVWFTPPPSGVRSGTIESVRNGPKGPLVKVSGIDERSAAEALRGCTLMAAPEGLPEPVSADPLDPVGYSVCDERLGDIGVVSGVIITGANDVWVVTGSRYGEVLLPVIDDVVLEVLSGENTVRVRLLDGLIEEG